MNEKANNMFYIDELREKLGFLPKKCVYKLVNGEIVIYSISEREDFSA